MRDKVTTVEEYLRRMPAETRLALENLRAVISDAAPEATEGISYQVPTFKQDGALVGYGGFADHCSFFVMSPAVMEEHKDLLAGYDTSTGTVRFTVDKPLPASLVNALVAARIKENQAQRKR